MRIAMITTLAGPGPIAGGVWQVAATQATALRESGHEVRLVAGWLGKNPPASLADVEQVELLPLRRLTPGSGIKFLLASGLQAKLKDISKWCDIAHLHLCRDFFTTACARYLTAHRLPFLSQTHGMLQAPSSTGLRVYDRLLLNAGLRGMSGYLALTEKECRALEYFGAQGQSIDQIDNACAAPAHQWCDPLFPSFLFASRLHPRKQPAIFVESAIRFLDNGNQARFIIAGADQGEGPLIQCAIDNSRYASSFRIVGPLGHEKLLKLLSSVTAMVLPSLEEPYPMIALEAAAMGVPMILTSQIGIADHVRRADAAELVHPDVDQVLAAMHKLSADSDRRLTLSGNARELYANQWHPAILARQLIERYERAIGAQKHSV